MNDHAICNIYLRLLLQITYSELKIKESYHIEQLKPELNKQVEHVN